MKRASLSEISKELSFINWSQSLLADSQSGWKSGMLKFLQTVWINLSETYELSVRALANYRASNDVNVFVVTVNVIEKVIDRPTQTPLIASPLIKPFLTPGGWQDE